MRYAALLRVINIGKAKQIKMALLKTMLEEIGYTQVKTLLNSGNAVFEAQETDPSAVQDELEQNLLKTFGFEVPTIIRTDTQIHTLVTSDPFKGVSISPNTRLYVTFLAQPERTSLSIPYVTPDVKIQSVTDTEICSVIEISSSKNTTDLMGIIEKEWGKNVTTRNWNTVQKIAQLLA